MAEFALYADGQFYKIDSRFAERPADVPRKGAEWFPVIREVGDDAFTGLDRERDAHVIRTLRPPVIRGDINQERDRRVATGFEFNGKKFQSRIEDQKRINGAGTLAAVAILGGAQAGDLRWHGGESDFVWITEDNSLMTMDAFQVIDFGKAAAQWESAHVFAARALKDLEKLPADYTDNKYWP